jgi:Cu(I)/Ag(I) efflux system membrane fusion protein
MPFMNKRILVSLLLTGIVFIFWYCNSSKTEKKVEVRPSPISFNENSGTFNESFSGLLTAYYALKDAFVASDTGMVNMAAEKLVLNADSLKINEIQGDTSGTIKETAQYFAATISSSGKNIGAQPGLEAKKRELNMITDAMWNLTRTVHFEGQKVYYQYWPMAFDNMGAYWLSDKREVVNPYFGKEMLNCGEVTDSLDYSKK